MKRVILGLLTIGLLFGFISVTSAEEKQNNTTFCISLGYGYLFNETNEWDGSVGITFGYFFTEQFQMELGVLGNWNTLGDKMKVLVRPNFYSTSEGSVMPYFGVSLGAEFGDGTSFAYGAQIGAKQLLSGNAFINYELNYLRADEQNSISFMIGLGFRF
ncbi:MAG: hypothetical protein NC926_01105 [Candidatus Omnitrophica bacterium]|nr:hypothetical protein [Candidatus Omnitrophota bacterium]MCM8806548.1 hypothetical protein [Candidatus Omnitrophota bacterium]